MPRNSSGTYTLPAGNPVAPNTIIETNWANPTMSDIGTALTDSLDRFGRGSMLAPIKGIDGTSAAPMYSFSSESTLGLYRVSAGVLGVVMGGVTALTIAATAVTFDPAAAPTWAADPVSANQLARKSYVDAAGSGVYLPLAGGTMTGAILGAAGAVGTPGYAFAGDANNGWWSPAADTQAWSTAGTERGRVNGTGNWSLAASSSGSTLDVQGGAGVPFRITTSVARGSGNVYLQIYDPSGAKGYWGYGGGNDKMQLAQILNADLDFYTNNALRATLQAAGPLYTFYRQIMDAPSAGAAFNEYKAATVTYAYIGERLGVIGSGSGLAIRSEGSFYLSTSGASVRYSIEAGVHQLTGQVGIGLAPAANFQVQVAQETGGGSSQGVSIVGPSGTRQLNLGVDATAGHTWVQSWIPGTGGGALRLNPQGGTVNYGADEVGYRSFPTSSQTSGTLTNECRGKIVYATGAVTLNTGFTAGDAFVIRNNSGGSAALTQGGSATINWFNASGTLTTGSRTMANGCMVSVVCVGTNTYQASSAGGLT